MLQSFLKRRMIINGHVKLKVIPKKKRFLPCVKFFFQQFGHYINFLNRPKSAKNPNVVQSNTLAQNRYFTKMSDFEEFFENGIVSILCKKIFPIFWAIYDFHKSIKKCQKCKCGPIQHILAYTSPNRENRVWLDLGASLPRETHHKTVLIWQESSDFQKICQIRLKIPKNRFGMWYTTLGGSAGYGLCAIFRPVARNL